MNNLLTKIKDWSQQVRDQKTVGGNSQTLVGGLLISIAEFIEKLNANKVENATFNTSIKELDDKVKSIHQGIIIQKAVATQNDLPKNPGIGWDVLVKNENMRYNWNGTDWISMETGIYDGDDKVDKTIIYNVSQLHNNYSFANNQIARKTVPTTYRKSGQIISYKLNTGDWVSEQYAGEDIFSWETDTYWEDFGLGGLDKIDGFGYRQTTIVDEIDFTNVITSTTGEINGKFISNSGVVENNGEYGYNSDFFAIKENTNFFCNIRSTWSGAPEILLYDKDKVFMGVTSTNRWTATFKTPSGVAYIRYNYKRNLKIKDSFAYPENKSETIVDDKISINLAIKDLVGAQQVNAVSNINIMPKDLKLTHNCWLDSNGAEIYENKPYYITDYIPIKGNMSYATNLPGVYYVSSMCYDGMKRPIKAIDLNTETTPPNARYYRYTANRVDLSPYYITEADNNKQGVMIPELFVSKANVISTEESRKVDSYTAIGDSITVGETYAELLRNELGIPNFFKYANGGFPMSELLNYVNKIEEDYRGLVTILLGANDIGKSSVGDFKTIINKPFDSLDNGSTFGESFRIGLETLIRKSPQAKIIVISPIQRGGTVDVVNHISHRQMLKDVCEALSIPYCSLYKTCGISYATAKLYLSDGVHPNSSGQYAIFKSLLPFVKEHLEV